MCKNSKVHAIKPYTLAEVSYKKKLFVHTALGSFFNKEGADKKFTLSQGFEWTGEDTFDDFT